MTIDARVMQASAKCIVGKRARRSRTTPPIHGRQQHHHQSARLSATILENAEGALTMKAVEMALGGDKTMLRLCLDRLDRVRDTEHKHRTVRLPEIKTIKDTQIAIETLLRETTRGTIEPKTASTLTNIIANLTNLMNNAEMVERIERLDDSTKN